MRDDEQKARRMDREGTGRQAGRQTKTNGNRPRKEMRATKQATATANNIAKRIANGRWECDKFGGFGENVYCVYAIWMWWCHGERVYIEMRTVRGAVWHAIFEVRRESHFACKSHRITQLPFQYTANLLGQPNIFCMHLAKWDEERAMSITTASSPSQYILMFLKISRLMFSGGAKTLWWHLKVVLFQLHAISHLYRFRLICLFILMEFCFFFRCISNWMSSSVLNAPNYEMCTRKEKKNGFILNFIRICNYFWWGNCFKRNTYNCGDWFCIPAKWNRKKRCCCFLFSFCCIFVGWSWIRAQVRFVDQICNCPP